MIKLELEMNEINGILTALGQMPYIQVQALIAKIQQQATLQIQDQTDQKQVIGDK